MITFQEARRIVRDRHGPKDPATPYAVAEYGAQDRRAWRVIHGHPDDVNGTVPEGEPPRRLDGPGVDTATLVTKTTGEVQDLPLADPANWDRLDAMERFGEWPA